jgi:hypothetical protein
MMPANVIKGAKGTISAAHYYDWLAGKSRRNEVSRVLHLAGASDQLPRLAEHIEPLKFGNARVNVPGRRNSRRLRQGSAVVVAG